MAGIIETQIFDAAPTLMYVFIPKGYKINARVATKQKKQIETLQSMCKAAGKSYAWGQSIVRDGVKAKFKKPVENVVYDFLNKDGVAGIGIIGFTAILGIIISAAPLIIQLLVSLKILPADFNINKIIPSESDVNGALPDPNGIGWGGGATQSAGMDNTILYVGGAVLAYTLYKSTQKK